MTKSTIDYLIGSNELQPSILVGIISEDRQFEFLSENDSFRNFALEFGTTYIDEKRLRGLDKEMKDELKELFQGPQANPFIIHNKNCFTVKIRF